MTQVCETCGLPNELCVCEDVSKSNQTVEIIVDERSYGKEVTIVKGFTDERIDIDSLSSELKSQFACGGTTTETSIELQGNHQQGLTDEMDERGFEVRQS